MSDDRDERALDRLVREGFQRWPDEPPPADFADRVMRARRVRSRRLPWLAGLAVAAAALLVVLVGRHVPADAEHVATERQSIALDGRGIAVMEAASALERHAGRWSQRAGNVFYRIERGGSFVLGTPAGEVAVLGTCFRVEVDPMKLVPQTKVGFVAGAALATVVVVTVYEGRVRLANGAGQRDLEAGEQGSFEEGQAPRALPASEAVLARPPVRPPALVAAAPPGELEALRVKVAAQEKELAALRETEKARKGGPWVDVPQDELVARAARCELRWDEPEIIGYEIKPIDEKSGWGKSAALSDTERDAYNEALRELQTSVAGQLRQLFIEQTGDAEMAGKLPVGGLIGLIREQTSEAARTEARAHLSRERAGLHPPPSDLARTPVIERAFRIMAGAGDELERRFAERVGAERAHALRKLRDGWPGGRSSMNGCAN